MGLAVVLVLFPIGPRKGAVPKGGRQPPSPETEGTGGPSSPGQLAPQSTLSERSGPLNKDASC